MRVQKQLELYRGTCLRMSVRVCERGGDGYWPHSEFLAMLSHHLRQKLRQAQLHLLGLHRPISEKAQHLLHPITCHCIFDTIPLYSLLPVCSRVRTTFANTKTYADLSVNPFYNLPEAICQNSSFFWALCVPTLCPCLEYLASTASKIFLEHQDSSQILLFVRSFAESGGLD